MSKSILEGHGYIKQKFTGPDFEVDMNKYFENDRLRAYDVVMDVDRLSGNRVDAITELFPYDMQEVDLGDHSDELIGVYVWDHPGYSGNTVVFKEDEVAMQVNSKDIEPLDFFVSRLHKGMSMRDLHDLFDGIEYDLWAELFKKITGIMNT